MHLGTVVFYTIILFAFPDAYKLEITQRQYCGSQNVQPTLTLKSMNGQIATKNSWPWVAAILVKDESTGELKFECSATLINPNDNPTESDIILTSAHCLTNNIEDTVVAFGTSNLNEQDPQKLIVPITSTVNHPNFIIADREEKHMDLALVKLANPVKFSDSIQAACLPKSKKEKIKDINGCLAVGFDGPSLTTYQTFSAVTDSSYGEWDITAKNPTHGGACSIYTGNSLFCRDGNKWVTYGTLVGSVEPVECENTEDWYSSTAFALNWILANSQMNNYKY